LNSKKLRELNVGELDGRNDEAAWDVYRGVLDRWRDGLFDERFPGGESCFELAARIRTALRIVAGISDGGHALICAHGANIRAALPLLADGSDPGTDLPTGGIARFEIDVSGSNMTIELRGWGDGSTRTLSVLQERQFRCR
jgi:broad specificity phosphatase PhoE